MDFELLIYVLGFLAVNIVIMGMIVFITFTFTKKYYDDQAVDQNAYFETKLSHKADVQELSKKIGYDDLNNKIITFAGNNENGEHKQFSLEIVQIKTKGYWKIYKYEWYISMIETVLIMLILVFIGYLIYRENNR